MVTFHNMKTATVYDVWESDTKGITISIFLSLAALIALGLSWSHLAEKPRSATGGSEWAALPPATRILSVGWKVIGYRADAQSICLGRPCVNLSDGEENNHWHEGSVYLWSQRAV